MSGGLAKALLSEAVPRRTGAVQGSAISTALLSTGVSLLLVRGRRPVGLALIVAGGLLRWAEVEKAGVSPKPGEPAGDASPATGSR